MAKKRYDDFIKWNDEMLKKFDLEHYHANANFVVRFIESRRVARILAFLTANDSDEIIEIGCGAGDIIGKIGKGRLTGVDISRYILDIARKRYPKVRFIVGDAENLPAEISQKQYDKIICSEVLEHVENPSRVLEEIKGLAKKDSVVVVSVPNEKLINRIKDFFKKMKIFQSLFPRLSRRMTDEWHLHYFDLAKLKRIAGRNYAIKSARCIPFRWLPLRYVVKMELK